MLEIFLIGLRRLSLGPSRDLWKLRYRASKKLSPKEFYFFQLAFLIVLEMRKASIS